MSHGSKHITIHNSDSIPELKNLVLDKLLDLSFLCANALNLENYFIIIISESHTYTLLSDNKIEIDQIERPATVHNETPDQFNYNDKTQRFYLNIPISNPRSNLQIFFVLESTNEKKISNKEKRALKIIKRKAFYSNISNQEYLNDNKELKLIFNNSYDIISVHNLDLSFQYISPAIKDITGYEPYELIGKSLFELIHKADDAKNAKTKIFESIKNSTGEPVQFKALTKSNAIIWLESYFKPFYNKIGEVIAYQSSTRNISKRKEYESELKINQANLFGIIENTKDLIWSIDTKYQMITSNSIFANALTNDLGHPLSPVEKIPFEKFNPENAQRWIQLYDKALQGERFTEDIEIIENNGEMYVTEYSFNPIKNDFGNIIGVSIFGRDVTAKRKELERFNRFHTSLKLINDLASDNFITDSERLEHALKTVCNFLKLPLGIISKIRRDTYTIVSFYSSNDAPLEIGQTFDFSQTYCNLTYEQDGVVAIDDMKNSRYNGHPCYQNFGLESYIGAIIMVNGRKFGTINFSSPELRKEPFDKYDYEFMQMLANWVGAEIERTRYEKKLREAIQKAEESSKAKAEFLSTMSHEIRTPLNSIIGTAHLLRDGDPKPDQVQQLNLLKFSSENLLAIVNDILDYSKIEEGKIVLDAVEFSLPALVESIILSHQQKAEEKGLKLIYEIDEEVKNIYISDSVRISQILNNLISNAIKFTLEGWVKLNVYLAKDHVDVDEIVFEVIDTGIGIEEDKLKMVFERFQQAESSITRKFGGSGLGLAITKRLLELMDSHINVNSEYQQGSNFNFKLLLKKSDKKEIYTNKNLEKEFEKGFSTSYEILLVEDNLPNQFIAKTFLEKWNLKVDIANNGIEATEMIRSKKYQLVLMDLQMPEMDGYTATKVIREYGGDYFTDIPILALSASAFFDEKKKAYEHGITDFVSKPIVPLEFLQKLSKHLNSHKSPSLKKTDLEKLTSKKAILTAFEEDFPYYNNLLRGDTNNILSILKKITEVFSDELQTLENNSTKIEYLNVLHKLKPHIKSLGEENIYNEIVKEEVYLKSNNLASEGLKNLLSEISTINDHLKEKIHFYEQNL